MNKKEISTAFDIFIKAHTPDEFKFPSVMPFWHSVEGKCATKRRPNNRTISNIILAVHNWWMNGKSPMLEREIMETLDFKYVTHGYVIVHGWHNGDRWNSEFLLSNVVDVMFDMSFRYNIIGVEQKPGRLEMWLKESPDHQSNITGEVIEKIAKCLEFQVRQHSTRQ